MIVKQGSVVPRCERGLVCFSGVSFVIDSCHCPLCVSSSWNYPCRSGPIISVVSMAWRTLGRTLVYVWAWHGFQVCCDQLRHKQTRARNVLLGRLRGAALHRWTDVAASSERQTSGFLSTGLSTMFKVAQTCCLPTCEHGLRELEKKEVACHD